MKNVLDKETCTWYIRNGNTRYECFIHTIIVLDGKLTDRFIFAFDFQIFLISEAHKVVYGDFSSFPNNFGCNCSINLFLTCYL